MYLSNGTIFPLRPYIVSARSAKIGQKMIKDKGVWTALLTCRPPRGRRVRFATFFDKCRSAGIGRGGCRPISSLCAARGLRPSPIAESPEAAARDFRPIPMPSQRGFQEKHDIHSVSANMLSLVLSRLEMADAAA